MIKNEINRSPSEITKHKTAYLNKSSRDWIITDNNQSVLTTRYVPFAIQCITWETQKSIIIRNHIQPSAWSQGKPVYKTFTGIKAGNYRHSQEGAGKIIPVASLAKADSNGGIRVHIVIFRYASAVWREHVHGLPVQHGMQKWGPYWEVGNMVINTEQLLSSARVKANESNAPYTGQKPSLSLNILQAFLDCWWLLGGFVFPLLQSPFVVAYSMALRTEIVSVSLSLCASAFMSHPPERCYGVTVSPPVCETQPSSWMEGEGVDLEAVEEEEGRGWCQCSDNWHYLVALAAWNQSAVTHTSTYYQRLIYKYVY